MKLLFLGDLVGVSGCSVVMKNLKKEIERYKIDFVVVNGENADKSGVGLTEEFVRICLIQV